MKAQLYCVDPLKLIEGSAYKGDIGLDLRTTSDPKIVGHQLRANDWKHIDYIEYDTNIKVALDPKSSKSVGAFLYPRSSISRYNLTLCNSIGVIDPGYRSTIKARFKYVPQPSDYIVFEKWLILRPSMDRIYQRGDKIAQLVFQSIHHPNLVNVKSLPKSERGEKGFGSSDS